MSSRKINTNSDSELGLTKEGVEYLEETRGSLPSRAVGRNTKKSLVVHYQSKKMGCSIVCESSLERYAAIEFELSNEVIEYYPQPPTCRVQKFDKRGRKIIVSYTPDFLVLKTDGIYVFEIKAYSSIEKLIVNKPREWKEENGAVINIPNGKHFASIGIEYEVLVPDKLKTVKFANLLVLDAATKLPWQYSLEEINTLIDALEKVPWMTISEAAQLADREDVTGVIQLIAVGYVLCDLDKNFLDMPDNTIISLKEGLLKFSDELGPFDDPVSNGLLGGLSTRDLELAVERLHRITGSGKKVLTRHDYRLLAKLSEARKKGVPDVVALAPKISKRGNRLPKIASVVFDYANKFIDEKFYKVRGQQKGALYYRYRIEASENHPEYSPVSKPTFYSYLKSRDNVEVALAQRGLRAANAVCSASEIKHRNVKSIVPFMEASVDHYKTDVFTEILGYGDVRLKKRLNLTVLVDIASGGILAFYLSIHSPSRVSVSIVLRKCIQTWGRLPRSIRMDRGAEFKSVYLDAVIAHFGVCKVMSPASHARFGSEVERLFLDIKNNWLAGRPGFVVDFGNRRGIDSSLDAPAQATLSPVDLVKEIRAFIEIRNNRPHGVRPKSPCTMIEDAFSRFGFCGIEIKYDKNLIVDTAVDLRKYSFCNIRGIKANGLFYWHPLMASNSLCSSKMEVRLEPENPFLLYVFLEEEWREAYAAGYQRFKSLKSDDVRMGECLWVYQGESIRKQIVEDAKVELAKAQRSFEEKDAEIDLSIIEPEFIESSDVDASYSISDKPFEFHEWNFDGEEGDHSGL